MFRPITLFALAIAVASTSALVHLPDEIKKCDVTKPDKDECLRTAIIDGMRKLKNGKKNLALLSLDPLAIDEVVLDLGTGAAPLLFTARNVKVYGLTDSYLKKVEFAPEKMALEFNSITPNGTFVFNYEANGRILLLPINGEGPGSFVLTDMDAVQRIEGVPIRKDGKIYMDVKKYNIKFDAKKLDINLQGLFKGNKQVSEQLSELLNREWRLFLDQLRGPAAEAFGTIFKDLCSRVFSRVPYDEIFPGAGALVENAEKSKA